jgi:hypothetical protein
MGSERLDVALVVFFEDPAQKRGVRGIGEAALALYP